MLCIMTTKQKLIIFKEAEKIYGTRAGIKKLITTNSVLMLNLDKRIIEKLKEISVNYLGSDWHWAKILNLVVQDNETTPLDNIAIPTGDMVCLSTRVSQKTKEILNTKKQNKQYTNWLHARLVEFIETM
jgi:hypothetical protein